MYTPRFTGYAKACVTIAQTLKHHKKEIVTVFPQKSWPLFIFQLTTNNISCYFLWFFFWKLAII